MNWHKQALITNDPHKNVEDQIFHEVVDRSDQEIQDLVDNNYDIIAEDAKRKIEIGIDLENIVDGIAERLGRSLGFSPGRSIEWTTFWSCIFEVIQPLTPSEGQDWEVLDI